MKQTNQNEKSEFMAYSGADADAQVREFIDRLSENGFMSGYADIYYGGAEGFLGGCCRDDFRDIFKGDMDMKKRWLQERISERFPAIATSFTVRPGSGENSRVVVGQRLVDNYTDVKAHFLEGKLFGEPSEVQLEGFGENLDDPSIHFEVGKNLDSLLVVEKKKWGKRLAPSVWSCYENLEEGSQTIYAHLIERVTTGREKTFHE